MFFYTLTSNYIVKLFYTSRIIVVCFLEILHLDFASKDCVKVLQVV